MEIILFPLMLRLVIIDIPLDRPAESMQFLQDKNIPIVLMTHSIGDVDSNSKFEIIF